MIKIAHKSLICLFLLIASSFSLLEESSSFMDSLYEEIDESYANDVISNFKSILKYFIFNDIIKNPPEPEGYKDYAHPAIDFDEAFENINTANRTFYDFYRELMKIIFSPRDYHLRIYSLKTPKGIEFRYATACLPFSLYVDKDENKDANYILNISKIARNSFLKMLKIMLKIKMIKKFL